MAEELIKPEQVCEMLKISMSALYKMVSKRRIPYKKISYKILRFSKPEIERWLKSKSVKDVYQKKQTEIMETIL